MSHTVVNSLFGSSTQSFLFKLHLTSFLFLYSIRYSFISQCLIRHNPHPPLASLLTVSWPCLATPISTRTHSPAVMLTGSRVQRMLRSLHQQQTAFPSQIPKAVAVATATASTVKTPPRPSCKTMTFARLSTTIAPSSSALMAREINLTSMYGPEFRYRCEHYSMCAHNLHSI
jgi:hypothetical protein